MRSSTDWPTALAAHRRSVDQFITAARAIPAAAWGAPIAPGKWSPAQTAEHLRLVYQVLGRELAGGPGLQIRTKWWQRLVLRAKFLPNILVKGKIPAGAPAPREARPGPGPFEREPLLAALLESAAATEQAMTERRSAPRAGVTHHIFGRLSLPQIVRFGTVHNDHHTRQLGRGTGAS